MLDLSASDFLPTDGFVAGNEAISAEPRAFPPTSSGHGTFFDERITLRDPEGGHFVSCVIDLYDKVRPRQRKSGREALATRINCLLANAIRTTAYRTDRSVLYFRKADAPQYADKPSWMRHGALGEVIDALADASLMVAASGRKMPWYSRFPSTASSYEPTDELLRIAAACGVTETSVVWTVQDDQLVQLLAPKPRRDYDWQKGEMTSAPKGQLIAFEPTPETDGWVASLKAINRLYRQSDIRVSLPEEDLARWLTKQSNKPDSAGADYKRPELFKKDIYRVFNNGEFSEGGRMFGGWWMNAPEGLRASITIDGQETLELDYAACHPRMLYHERGLDFVGDPYDLPEIAKLEAAEGVSQGHYRPYVKWLFQVLINSRGRPAAVQPPPDRSVPTCFTPKQVISFIEARHQAIAEAFATGAGLRLMRHESDIAFEVITTAMKEGWVALSIHDSFIATREKMDRLRSLMVGLYVSKFGREPIIKR
jgi:hypothetical protein